MANRPKVTVVQKKRVIVMQCPDIDELNGTIRMMKQQGGWRVEHLVRFEPRDEVWRVILSRPDETPCDLPLREDEQ